MFGWSRRRRDKNAMIPVSHGPTGRWLSATAITNHKGRWARSSRRSPPSKPMRASTGASTGASRTNAVARAAEQRDELAPPDHSITSSAVASSEFGIVTPKSFAALRLITNSNLVGRSIGKSDGRAPQRILETYKPTRRYRWIKSGP
jgi:hypothetical protein